MINIKPITIAISLLSLCIISCNKESKVENKTTEKVKTEREAPAPLFVNNTAVSLNVQNEGDLIGLWTGSFDTTQESKELQILWNTYTDSVYKILSESEDNFDDLDIREDQFYNTLDEKYKKFIDKDVQYGFGYIIRPNKISVFISTITDSVITGKSICAGNERSLKGKFLSKSDDGWEIVLNEPGNDKYDGSIVLKIYKNETGAIGSYSPFDTLQKAKTLKLKRKNFKYDIDAVWTYSGRDSYVEDFNPSKRIFTIAEVENQPKSVLRIARNSIYARHGYSFKKKDIRNYFERFDDYIPIVVDVRKELSAIEIKNEALLKRYEEYANDFYDAYGR